MQRDLIPGMGFLWFFSVMLCVALSFELGAPQKAYACGEVGEGWGVQSVYPSASLDTVPVNGVVAVNLEFFQGFESAPWPSLEDVTNTVAVRVTRDGGEEVVAGSIAVDPTLRQVRFVADRLLAEGIEYTVEVELKNQAFGGEQTQETYAFTTGDGLDESPPAFSGLQDAVLTEQPRPVNECCDAECVCECTCVCTSCWVVDWEYPRAMSLSWRPVEDEYGFGSLAFLLYRHSDPQDEEGVLVDVLRAESAEARMDVIPIADEDAGPWCYSMRVRDIYGRTGFQTSMICRQESELVEIERLDVPEPDRSQCLESGEDVGGDDVGVDAGGDDAGVGQDTAGGIDGGGGDVGPIKVVDSSSNSDDSCSCGSVSGAGKRMPLGALLWGMLGCFFVWRLRR